MSWRERFKIIPSVYLILKSGDAVLLLRRFQTGFEDGKYGLPAGHGESGESIRNATVRETREETGVIVDPANMRLVHTMHRTCGDHERLDFFFEALEWQGDVHNNEPDKCDDIQWFPFDALPENTIEYIRVALDTSARGVAYSEYGWEK